MRAQVRRVGEAWELIERTILVGKKYKNADGKEVSYTERGLKQEWLDWMKARHKKNLDALTKAMDDKLLVFDGKPGVITKLKRWDYGGNFKRKVDVPNCGFEKDQKTIDERVELLKAAYKAMKRVDSELKLD